MNLSLLPSEVLVSLVAILIVATIGCVAALRSWTRISAEKRGVKRAESALISDDAWHDAYPHDKLKLAIWLRQKGIRPDSHLGDFIRTCWSAWLGGRPASLTELHVLVARRERSHGSSRLSAGIAALLLVLGIIGTLSSIKPVLHNFKFQVAEDAIARAARENSEDTDNSGATIGNPDATIEDASVAANTELVNSLIHDLGNAFWPSLLALAGTIAVVTCRGLYSLSLNKFTLDLDRFAVDTLIPRYRIPSLSEQYQEVKVTLTNVTESILQRESRFHQAVEGLEKLVGGISPALSGLDAAAAASRSAAENLSSRAQSITDGLTRHLGPKSQIHRAIVGFEGVFEKTEAALGNLSSVIEEIGQSNISSRLELASAIETLTQSVGRIAADHQNNQSEAKTALRDFKDKLMGIPALIQGVSEKTVAVGIAAVKSSVAKLHEEQKKWHASSANDLSVATTAGLAGVTRAGQQVANHAGMVAAAVTDIGTIKTEAGAAIQAMASTGTAQIKLVGDSAKDSIEGVVGRFAKEADRIALATERLNKIQPVPTVSPGRGEGKWGMQRGSTRGSDGGGSVPLPKTLGSDPNSGKSGDTSIPIVSATLSTGKIPESDMTAPKPVGVPEPVPVDPAEANLGDSAEDFDEPKPRWWRRVTWSKLKPFSKRKR